MRDAIWGAKELSGRPRAREFSPRRALEREGQRSRARKGTMVPSCTSVAYVQFLEAHGVDTVAFSVIVFFAVFPG